MDHEFLSIVEKLAILEGRIAPKDNVIAETATKQKKPALFANLKKKEESAIPMVGGVEFAEEKSADVLSQVRASLADYLKNAEDNIRQDRDLLAKKKQDLDLKKKELRDLELQAKEEVDEYDMSDLQRDADASIKASIDKASDARIAALKNPPKEKSFIQKVGDKQIGMVKGAWKGLTGQLEETDPANVLEDHINIGDRVRVVASNEYNGMEGEVFDLGQRGAFIIVDIEGDLHSMHSSDVEVLHKDVDWEQEELDEEPNQTPAGGEGVANDTDPTYAQGGNNTYAEGMTAPVKTMNVPLDEMGGSVLVEIHGDERAGFCIKRAGKEMATRFATLEEAEMALEMYNAHRAKMMAANQSADYIEEK
jgi:hypothetical protein